MKLRRFFSFVLALIIAVCSFQTIAFAEDNTEHNDIITIEFHNEISAEAKERVIAHFHGEDENVASTRGLTCTLFGHKLETGTTSVVTHKVSATAPRCLRETYDYEICSRCDYSNYTLIGSEYIYCCS